MPVETRDMECVLAPAGATATACLAGEEREAKQLVTVLTLANCDWVAFASFDTEIRPVTAGHRCTSQPGLIEDMQADSLHAPPAS